MKDSRHGQVPWTIGMVVALVVSLYCLMGIFMVVDFAGTPGYPHSKAVQGVNLWGIGTLLCMAAFVYCAVVRRRKKAAAKRQTVPASK